MPPSFGFDHAFADALPAPPPPDWNTIPEGTPIVPDDYIALLASNPDQQESVVVRDDQPPPTIATPTTIPMSIAEAIDAAATKVASHIPLTDDMHPYEDVFQTAAAELYRIAQAAYQHGAEGTYPPPAGYELPTRTWELKDQQSPPVPAADLDANDRVCIIAGCGNPQAPGSYICPDDAYDPFTGAVLWPRGKALDTVLRERFDAGYIAGVKDAKGQESSAGQSAVDNFTVAASQTPDDPAPKMEAGRHIPVAYLCLAPDCLYRAQPGYRYCPAHAALTGAKAAHDATSAPCPVAFCGHIAYGANDDEISALLAEHQKDIHCDHAGRYDPDCDCHQICCADGACPDDDSDQPPPASLIPPAPGSDSLVYQVPAADGHGEALTAAADDPAVAAIRKLRDMPFDNLPDDLRQWLVQQGIDLLYEQGPPAAIEPFDKILRSSKCWRADCDTIVTTDDKECPTCGLGWPYDDPFLARPKLVVSQYPELECNGVCSVCGTNHYPQDTAIPVSPYCYNCAGLGHYQTDCDGDAGDRTDEQLLAVVIDAQKTIAHFTKLMLTRRQASTPAASPRVVGMTNCYCPVCRGQQRHDDNAVQDTRC